MMRNNLCGDCMVGQDSCAVTPAALASALGHDDVASALSGVCDHHGESRAGRPQSESVLW
eukprot:912377-Amphidinium_carterae.1